MRARQLDQTVEKRTAELRETIQQLETFSYSSFTTCGRPCARCVLYAAFSNSANTDKLDPPGATTSAALWIPLAAWDALITDVLSYSRVAGRSPTLAPSI
jgi:hypothetical protein